jgi:PAS domain S-box-containing protein
MDAHKLIWLIGALLVALMAVFQVYDVLRRRAIVLETTERTNARLARAVADRTLGILHAADLALREISSAASSAAGHPTATTGGLHDRLSALPLMRSVTLLGADGSVVAHAGAPPSSGLLQQVLTATRGARDRAQDLSSVLPLRDNGAWTIAMWRRVKRTDGALGTAAAFLDLGYIARSYTSLDLGASGEVSLLDSDGRVIARSLAAAVAAPEPIGQQAERRELLVADAAGTLVGQSRRGRRETTVAIQALADFPLAVATVVDNATVLEPWNVQAMHSALRTSLFCLSVLLLLTLVLRQLKRREQAESSLRVQTALLDELFESAPEAIVMLDAEQRVTRVNREFSHMFGFSPQQSCGRPLVDLIVPDGLKEDARRMAEAVRAGRQTSTETVRARSDGARLYVSELGTPITEAEGNVASYAIYRDITERRLAEAERSKLETRLRQAEKLEAIGAMAGGIAHDFNSVITAILGYGELARSAAPDSTTLKRYMGSVLSAANRAKALVDQILTYSRSARSKRSVINPRLPILETVDLVRASLPANIDLRLQLSTGQASVIADPTQIHQVVMNLCTNAVHAMRAGGMLSLVMDAVDAGSDSELSHGLLAAGRYVRLSVHDTGCGMSPEVLERIFEPFFTTKEPGRGTGLGLALVQGIVSELGGAVDVVSAPGAGSSFHLYFPCSDAITTLEAAALSKGAGQQVLVVEDETPLMLLLEEMLAALGYEPAGFTRPSEALDDFRAAPIRFDAAVLDYLMPEMTGIELAKRLRLLRAGIPVVLVSGYEGPLLMQEAAAAGVEHIVTKPLNLQQLAEVMAKVLGASGTR